MRTRLNAAFTALVAAALFGASTPLAKHLLGAMPPFMLAVLFYLGSGVGLAATMLARRVVARQSRQLRQPREPGFRRAELAWLGGAIVAGGIAAPALLMFGLATTPAATGSLLLNLEACSPR